MSFIFAPQMLPKSSGDVAIKLDKIWARADGNEVSVNSKLLCALASNFPPLEADSFERLLVRGVGYFDRNSRFATADNIIVHTNVKSFIQSLICFVHVHRQYSPNALNKIREQLHFCLLGSASAWYRRVEFDIDGDDLFELMEKLLWRYGVITQNNPKTPSSLLKSIMMPSLASRVPASSAQEKTVKKSKLVTTEQSRHAQKENVPASDAASCKVTETVICSSLKVWHISDPNPEAVGTSQQFNTLKSTASSANQAGDGSPPASTAPGVKASDNRDRAGENSQEPAAPLHIEITPNLHIRAAEDSQKPAAPFDIEITSNLTHSDGTTLTTSTVDIRNDWTEVDADSAAGTTQELLHGWEVL